MRSDFWVWRKQNNLTLEDIGSALGFCSQTIRQWEFGISNMSLDAYLRWKAFFDFDPIEKFGLKLGKQAQKHLEYMEKLNVGE